MKRLLFALIFIAGCVQPYDPGKVGPKPPGPEPTKVTPKESFETYKKEVAANFRTLAANCMNGDYEFVSELLDASAKLDKEAKDKRNSPFNTEFESTLGSEKLDKDKAYKLLNKFADELDPAGKVIVPPVKTTYIDRQLILDTPIESAKVVFEPPTEDAVKRTKVRKIVRLTQEEIINNCRHDVQPYDVIGTSFKDHLINDHGFTVTQLNNLAPRTCKLIHENVHANVIRPSKIVMEDSQ